MFWFQLQTLILVRSNIQCQLQLKPLRKGDPHSIFVHAKLTTHTHTKIYFSEGISLASLAFSWYATYFCSHPKKNPPENRVGFFFFLFWLLSSTNTWILIAGQQKCLSPIGKHCKTICSHPKTMHNSFTQPATALFLALTDPAINCAFYYTYSLSGT